MNKAEGHILFHWGQTRGRSQVFGWGYFFREDENFAATLKGSCYASINQFDPSRGDASENGRKEYLETIIHAIDGKAITDWPSFVTYMTGETYE